MRRKKQQKEADRELLEAIFRVEAEWKNMQHILEHSIEPVFETRDSVKLAEVKYMFLLNEAKIRNISLLRY